MVFRSCWNIEKNPIPPDWEGDLSDFIGQLWRALSPEAQLPATQTANEITSAHKNIFQGYRYQPGLKKLWPQDGVKAEGVVGLPQDGKSSGPQRRAKMTTSARKKATSSPSRRSKRSKPSPNNCFVSTFSLHDPNEQDIQRYPAPTPIPFPSPSSPSGSYLFSPYDDVSSPSVPSPSSSAPSLVVTPTSPVDTSFPVTPASQGCPSAAGSPASHSSPYVVPSVNPEADLPQTGDHEHVGAGTSSSDHGLWDNASLDGMGVQKMCNESLSQSALFPNFALPSSSSPSMSYPNHGSSTSLEGNSSTSPTSSQPITAISQWDLDSILLSQYLNAEAFTSTSPGQDYSPQYPDGFLPASLQLDSFWSNPSASTSQDSVYDPYSLTVDTDGNVSSEQEAWAQEVFTTLLNTELGR